MSNFYIITINEFGLFSLYICLENRSDWAPGQGQTCITLLACLWTQCCLSSKTLILYSLILLLELLAKTIASMYGVISSYVFKYAYYKSIAQKAFLFTGLPEKTKKPTMAVVIMI